MAFRQVEAKAKAAIERGEYNALVNWYAAVMECYNRARSKLDKVVAAQKKEAAQQAQKAKDKARAKNKAKRKLSASLSTIPSLVSRAYSDSGQGKCRLCPELIAAL